MPHQCILDDEETPSQKGKSFWSWLKEKYLQFITLSEKNPICPFYFRSKKSLKEEKIRQLNSKNWYIIHPLSRLRQVYDTYIFMLYFSLLVTKLVDASSGSGATITDTFPNYPILSTVLDLLSWLDITTRFFLGYIDKTTKHIVLEPKKIARRYVFSIFFITDVLSSIPKFTIVLLDEFIDVTFTIGVLNIFYSLKYVRLFTEIKLVSKISLYFSVRSKTVVFLISSMLLFAFVLHFSTCQLMVIPKLVQFHFSTSVHTTTGGWLDDFQGENYLDNYIICMFKSSAYLLGIRLNLKNERFNPEDYAVVVTTYVVGKVLIASTWIVLAMAILNSRSMDIKFRALMNQLDEYMRQKQLPLDLRSRITTYYEFKYQRTFFKEEMINNILSEGLRKDINIHICRSLIASVSLFADLTPRQVSDVVALLIPEIFLPNDIIIQSGSHGEAMYFLSSGTVAVFTHSGKEVCHLQDGAYFGEISLVLRGQFRTATIIAIEICQVYRLNKRDFKKSLLKNKFVFSAIVSHAEQRLKDISKLEETYKKALFEQKFSSKSPEKTDNRKSVVPND